MLVSNKLLMEYNRAKNAGGIWKTGFKHNCSKKANQVKNQSIKPPTFICALLRKAQ